MRTSVSRYFKDNLVGFLALFVALGGTGAYAANTIGSTDIIDGQVKSADIGDAEVKSADVKDESLTTFDVSTFLGADVVDGTLTGADVGDESLTTSDIQNFSLGNGDFLDGSVDSRVATDNSLTGFDIKDGQIGQVDIADTAINSAKVADNSLTGTDINESTLNLPGMSTATFAYPANPVKLPQDESFVKITSKNLTAGSWAVIGTATTHTWAGTPISQVADTFCELRNGAAFIGGTADRRVIPDKESVYRSLAMTGGAQVPAGGGEVSLWCRSQDLFEQVEGAQIMMIRVGGFS